MIEYLRDKPMLEVAELECIIISDCSLDSLLVSVSRRRSLFSRVNIRLHELYFDVILNIIIFQL